ncbi:unnamed protein product, partial [Mesorhabditis spiculigera]
MPNAEPPTAVSQPEPAAAHNDENMPIQSSRTPAELQELSSKRHEVLTVQCKVCKDLHFNSEHLAMVFVHLLRHDKSIGRVYCYQCGETFMRKDKCKDHLRTRCPEGHMVVRNDNDYKTVLRQCIVKYFPEMEKRLLDQLESDLRRPRYQDDRLNQKLKQDDKKIDCQICKKTVKNYSANKNHHARTHMSRRRYRCPGCDKSSHMKDNLKVHSIKKHGKQLEIIDQQDEALEAEHQRILNDCFPKPPAADSDEEGEPQDTSTTLNDSGYESHNSSRRQSLGGSSSSNSNNSATSNPAPSQPSPFWPIFYGFQAIPHPGFPPIPPGAPSYN